MYEPIWEAILSRLNDPGIRVRSIWIADVATQSASGLLNEENLGNDREFLFYLLLKIWLTSVSIMV